ncbi:MAG: tetratricopeptide repeat protein [Dysgonamonadaceae bacterium]|nr:tetratricopeptide repeat protein [Dysgonamonadaceae bacterium]
MEAIRLKENDNYTDAFSAFTHALKIDSTSSVAWAELSDYFLFLQQDSLAIDALQKAVRFGPDNFEYKTMLANLYRESKRDDEAIAIYEELLKEKPDKYDFNFYLSELYLKKGDVQKSVKSLDDLENNIGINEALTMQKVRLYDHVGQTDKAIGELNRLAAKFPQESRYQLMTGDYFLSLAKPDSALAYYRKALEINPSEPLYAISMANYYETIGDKAAAGKEIETAIKNPLLDYENKLSILGGYITNLSRRKENLDSIYSLFDILFESYPNEKELNLIYGRFLMQQGKNEEAVQRFRQLTEIDPEDVESWRQLLIATAAEGTPDAILEVSDEGIKRFPDAPDFYFYKGFSLLQKKQYKDALAILEEGIDLAPESNRGLMSMYYNLLGDLYFQMGEKNEAFDAYDKSLEFNPNNAGVLNNYAYYLSLEKKDLDKAEQMIGRCLKMDPNNPTYIDTYAWVFFQKGNYSLAKFYIENAISNGGGDHADLWDHYGDILFKLGNTEQAVEKWKEALKIKDKSEDLSLLKKKIKDKMYYEK